MIVLNMTVDALASAPVFTETQFANGDFSAITSQLTSFWNGQGVQIPRTGSTSGTTSTANLVPAFLSADNYKTVKVVDASNNSVGTTQDFIVDSTNGTVNFVVIQAGSAAGAASGKMMVVPLVNASWQGVTSTASSTSGSGASSSAANGTGYTIVINVPASAWAGAPTFTDWTALNLTSPDFATQINSYWTPLFQTK